MPLRILPSAWYLTDACKPGVEKYAKEHPEGQVVTPSLIKYWHIQFGLQCLMQILRKDGVDLMFNSAVRQIVTALDSAEPAAECRSEDVARNEHHALLQARLIVNSLYVGLAETFSQPNNYRPEVWPYLVVEGDCEPDSAPTPEPEPEQAA